jgi:hypothetical protein
MQVFVLIVGLGILWFWNHNRSLDLAAAAPVYQKYGTLILIVGLALCGAAGFL